MTLHHTDCMAFMAEQPDKSFDLGLIDPPYRDSNNPHRTMKRAGSMASIVGRPDQAFFDEVNRVCQHWIIWGANNFALAFKGFVVWSKTNIPNNFTMSKAEIAALSESLATTSKVYQGTSVDKNRIHPNQKPVALYGWLLKNYAKAGYRILDTHLGSGSSAIAAHHNGHFDFVGCEINQKYFNDAKKRIAAETQQLALTYWKQLFLGKHDASDS